MQDLSSECSIPYLLMKPAIVSLKYMARYHKCFLSDSLSLLKRGNHYCYQDTK